MYTNIPPFLSPRLRNLRSSRRYKAYVRDVGVQFHVHLTFLVVCIMSTFCQVADIFRWYSWRSTTHPVYQNNEIKTRLSKENMGSFDQSICLFSRLTSLIGTKQPQKVISSLVPQSTLILMHGSIKSNSVQDCITKLKIGEALSIYIDSLTGRSMCCTQSYYH